MISCALIAESWKIILVHSWKVFPGEGKGKNSFISSFSFGQRFVLQSGNFWPQILFFFFPPICISVLCLHKYLSTLLGSYASIATRKPQGRRRNSQCDLKWCLLESKQNWLPSVGIDTGQVTIKWTQTRTTDIMSVWYNYLPSLQARPTISAQIEEKSYQWYLKQWNRKVYL